MLELRGRQPYDVPPWVGPLLGLLAGLLAVGLLATTRLPLAVGVLAGMLAAFIMATAPQLGLYGAGAVMIVFLPGLASRGLELSLALATLLWALAVRRRLLPPDPVLAVLAAIVGLIWLSALGVGTSEAVRRALAYTGALLFYWAASTLAVADAVLRRFVGTALVAGVVIAVIGIVQVRFPFIGFISFVQRFSEFADSGSLTEAQLWNGVFRVESLTGGPNLLGLSMQILLPFAFFWMLQRTTITGRAVGTAALVLLVAAMLLSLTRGVLLTTPLVIVPVVATYLGWKRSLPYLAAAGLAVGAVSLAWEPLRSRIGSNLTELFGGDTALSGTWRLESIPYGLAMFRDYFWFGAGIEQQVGLWRHYAPSDMIILREMVLHNDYLLFGIELGVLGVVLLIALLAVTSWRLLRAQAHFQQTRQITMLHYTCATQAAWLALAANLMIYPLLHNFRYVWVLLAIAGMLTRLAADQRAGACSIGARASSVRSYEK